MKFPKLKSPAILSPMAGVTDVAFRTLAKQYGAGMTYTEFVNSTGLVRGSTKTQDMLVVDPIEQPVAVQLFGSSVHDVVTAAKHVAPHFDVIDVNCGCPAWKVIKTGAGSALLAKPKGIAQFIEQLVAAVDKPITLKIRTGIDDKHITAVNVAQLAEQAGAAAIAVHGRTQQQGYSGKADWEIIKQVKESVNIPVIGNGDVTTPEMFLHRLETSGVDAIMIARGAIANPYIFHQINDYLKTGSYDALEGIAQFEVYLSLAEKYNLSFSVIKQHALSFTKGMQGGAKLREQLTRCETLVALREVMGLQIVPSL